jgi:hypothetical protein
LMGMFANLAAGRAAALAANLESIGRASDTAGLVQAVRALETESATLFRLLDSCLLEVCR